jgi:hypothetical protein
VPDGYPANLDAAELDHPGADPAVLATELCEAGIWQRAEGGTGRDIADSARFNLDASAWLSALR